MFVGDIGDDGCIEFAGADPVLGQTMRRGLQDGDFGLVIAHLCQITLRFRGVWRGGVQAGLIRFLPDLCAHRTDHTRPDAGGQQYAID